MRLAGHEPLTENHHVANFSLGFPQTMGHHQDAGQPVMNVGFVREVPRLSRRKVASEVSPDAPGTAVVELGLTKPSGVQEGIPQIDVNAGQSAVIFGDCGKVAPKRIPELQLLLSLGNRTLVLVCEEQAES